MGLGAATIVVQRNDDIVERAVFAETEIEEGDRLELIRLVGGG
jgi:thiamine biosynthesis protein ThiS